MASLNIVALDGALSSDFGWAIPIVREAGVFYLLGETSNDGLAIDQLGPLSVSKKITLVNPVVLGLREDAEQVDDFFACRSFAAPLMAFYWSQSASQNLHLRMEYLTKGGTSVTATGSIPKRVTLLPISGLIRCLRGIVRAMCGHFLQLLADDIGDSFSFAEDEGMRILAKNEALQKLAEMAYRLAPDRGWAKEAIAQKSLLLLLGDHPASVPTWLSSVASFWGHPSTLDYWQSAAHALIAAAKARVALTQRPEAHARRNRTKIGLPEKGIKFPSHMTNLIGQQQLREQANIAERESIAESRDSITIQ